MCANDWVALAALDYLKHRRSKSKLCPVVQVVGFDNTYEAFDHNFTSYNFNIPALLDAMLSHILSPRRFGPRARTPERIRIEGGVIKRGIVKPGR